MLSAEAARVLGDRLAHFVDVESTHADLIILELRGSGTPAERAELRHRVDRLRLDAVARLLSALIGATEDRTLTGGSHERTH